MFEIKRKDLVRITKQVVEDHRLDWLFVRQAEQTNEVAFGSSHVGEVTCIGAQTREHFKCAACFNGPVWDQLIRKHFRMEAGRGIAKVIDD